jgi:hypothetical protein
MVRPSLNLELFRKEIQILITKRLTLENIVRIIRDTHGNAYNYYTLKRRVKAWNII